MEQTTDAMAELSSLLQADPPSSLAALDPSVITGLTSAIRAESRRQTQEIERSVNDALRLVPRPFRGIVKKMIAP